MQCHEEYEFTVWLNGELITELPLELWAPLKSMDNV